MLGDEHAVPFVVNVQLLRPAKLNGGQIHGVGNVLRKGNSVMASEGHVWQGGALIAKVAADFVHFEKRP